MTEHNATQMMEETADLPEHPWPYLGELFKLEERKKERLVLFQVSPLPA